MGHEVDAEALGDAKDPLTVRHMLEHLLAQPLPELDDPFLMAGWAEMKADLMNRGQATELFARERDNGLDSILCNLDQTVFGEPAYLSVESKAAHLLYFVVKNHPFIDGNKRSAAFLFVDFLNQNRRLVNQKGVQVVNDIGLAALTLLVAESDPSGKDVMIRLMMNMLAGENAS
jgi:prophage maintenance system killer protein